MILFAKCPSCKEHVSIKSSAMTRPELAQHMGENFNINCTNCGNNFSNHTNEIRAKSNNNYILTAVGISLLVTGILFLFFGLIATLSMSIAIYVSHQQNTNVHAFNTYRI